jgi:hypothetical protein
MHVQDAEVSTAWYCQCPPLLGESRRFLLVKWRDSLKTGGAAGRDTEIDCGRRHAPRREWLRMAFTSLADLLPETMQFRGGVG